MSEVDDRYIAADQYARDRVNALTSDESYYQVYQEHGIMGVMNKPMSLDQLIYTGMLAIAPEVTLTGSAGSFALKKVATTLFPNHPGVAEAADLIGGLAGGLAGGAVNTETILNLFRKENPELVNLAEKALKSPEIRRELTSAAREATERNEEIKKQLLKAESTTVLKQKTNIFNKVMWYVKNPQIAMMNSMLASPKILGVKAATDAINVNTQGVYRSLGIGMKYGKAAGAKAMYAFFKGQLGAMSDGLNFFKLSWQSGEGEFLKSLGIFEKQSNFALEHTRDMPYEKSFRYLGSLWSTGIKYLNYGPRLIGAIDNFSKCLALRGAQRQLLYTEGLAQAEKMGLNNWRSIDHFATHFMEDQLDNGVSDAIMQQSIDLMHNWTFTDMGKVSRHLASAVHDFPPLRVFFPWTRTPINIMTEALYQSPLAPMTSSFWQDIGRNGVDANIAMAKWALSSLMWGKLGEYVSKGDLVGNGPQGPNRQYWPFRHRPTSWQIGNHSYNYGHLGPVGESISNAADAWDMYYMSKDPIVQNRIVEATTKLVGQVIDNNDYFEVLRNVVHAADGMARGNDKALQELAGRVGSEAIPAPFRMVAEAIHPEEHVAPTDWLGELKEQIPFWSSTLPPKRDQWGQIVYPPATMGNDNLLSAPEILANTLSPVSVLPENKIDPVDTELYRLGIYHRDVPNYIWKKGDDTVAIQPDVQDEWRKLIGNDYTDGAGLNQHDAMMNTISDPDYQLLDDTQKKNKLDKIHHQYYHNSRMQLLDNHPDLSSDVDTAQQMQGTTPPGPVEISPEWMKETMTKVEGPAAANAAFEPTSPADMSQSLEQKGNVPLGTQP